MPNPVVNGRCETLARVIAGLSLELQGLTRELALRQGCLLQWQGQREQDPDKAQRAAEDVAATEDRMAVAAHDLVELERAFAEWCYPPAPPPPPAVGRSQRVPRMAP